MKHRPRKEPDPLNWNFASPEREIDELFCYEFSRESQEIRDRVDFIRHGQIDAPTYWTPNPAFGWPEWPAKPYLSIPQAERERRIKILLALNDDHILALRARPPSGDYKSSGKTISVYLSDDATLDEQIDAAAALIRIENRGAKPARKRQTGHGATKAGIHDQLRALSVLRLRRYYTAPETLLLLEKTSGRQVYADETAMERAKRRARRHLCGFHLRALDRIRHGLWFPPFGKHLLLP